MIAIEQRQFPAGQFMASAMAEGQAGGDDAQRARRAVVRDATEGEDRLQAWQGLDAIGQEGPTGVDFRRRRLVLRRHATHGVGDDRIHEPQAVIGPRGENARRKAEFSKRRVKQVAGEIASEGPARAVRALEARSETNDEKPRLGVAKFLNRRVMPTGFPRAGGQAKRDQTRAQGTVATRLGIGIDRLG